VPLLLPMLGTASLHDIFSVTGSVVQSDAAAVSVASRSNRFAKPAHVCTLVALHCASNW
jgi:hypothetical protein